MLGAPACSKLQSVYLKVVYACINSEVLKPTYAEVSIVAGTNNDLNTKDDENTSIKETQTSHYYDSIPPSLTTITPNEKEKTIITKDNDNNNKNNNNKDGSRSTTDPRNEHEDDHHVEGGQFDRSYIISSSHGGTHGGEDVDTNVADPNTKSEDNEIKDTRSETNGKEVSIVKAKDQSKLKQQSEVVVGIASDILSSYKHITDNTEEFLLFVGLAVALGLGLFLALVVWGMYRSNRLTRIKNRLRKPNIMGNNLMTTSDTNTNTANGTMSDIIDAYVNSPITGK